MSEQIPVRNITPPPAKGGESVDLYASREKIYTRAFTGLFRNLRLGGGAFLFLLYFGTVWLSWNDRQAVWWNLPERKFFIFGATFWPQDFALLSWLLIICAFGLFFITVFAGRVWCGYTCPQSVWTWIFMWCEKVTEGDRNQRMKLDKAPMSANKLLRKAAKHSLWLLIGLVTGLTFVGYFSPIRDLLPSLLSGTADGWAYFWVGFFTLATYGNAGWLREQVCKYMCPYARFQSAMFDRDTLIVTYDAARGEPRNPRQTAPGAGDCIDCSMCVQVCPTGIDIRKGLQYECIGCAACVDACNGVMDKVKRPRGLIRYATENALVQRFTPAQVRQRVLRPRVLVYTAVLAILGTAMVTSLALRNPLKLDVIRDRGSMGREVEDGMIENVYRLQLMNTVEDAQRLRIAVSGIKSARVVEGEVVDIDPASTRAIPVRVRVNPGEAMPGSNRIAFHVTSSDGHGLRVEEAAVFLVPK